MTKRLPDLEAWAIFATIAETGSFAAAARELGLSNPTVSKAVGRLEARIGLALFARTSRRIALTEAGRAALERATQILHGGDALERQAAELSVVPRGSVRLTAPVSFGVGYLGAVLPEFLAAYPEITLDCALSDRHVNLVAEGFDLALRIAALDDSSLLARRLSTVRILPVAAPSHLAAHGRPTHPAQVEGHAALGYVNDRAYDTWHFSHPRLGEQTVTPKFRIWADNAELLKPALVGGHGIALQPEFLVWRELRDGALERVLPEWSCRPLALTLLMPPSPLRPLRVQVLIDYLAGRLASAPWVVPGA